jgi:mono/diheme cytochrome c family protein
MKNIKPLAKYAVVGLMIAGLGLAFSGYFDKDAEGLIVDVSVPELSSVAARGKVEFDANCAQCHGKNAAGTGKGPPLIHNVYNPGHHSDQAFLLAAKRGVRQHHWPYGNMPPLPQVSGAEITAIVKYVRELQVANGIIFKPHRM